MDKINPLKMNPWKESYTGYLFDGKVKAALCRREEKIWFEKDGKELYCSKYPTYIISGCEFVKMDKLIDLRVEMEENNGTYSIEKLMQIVESTFDLFNFLKADEFRS